MIDSFHKIEDSTLVKGILTGDNALFAELMSRHEKRVMSYLYNRCGNANHVDDLFQETCIAVYKNLFQYKQEYPFSSWLFGIARNKVNQFYRTTTPELTLEEGNLVDHSSPDTQISKQEDSDLFWQEARSQLNEEQLSVLSLRYQEDMTVKEIALILDKSESNIKIHLFRARKKLAESLILQNLIIQ